MKSQAWWLMPIFLAPGRLSQASSMPTWTMVGVEMGNKDMNANSLNRKKRRALTGN